MGKDTWGSVKQGVLKYDGKHSSRIDHAITENPGRSLSDLREKWDKEEKRLQRLKAQGYATGAKHLARMKPIFLQYLIESKKIGAEKAQEQIINECSLSYQQFLRILSKGLKHKWHKEVSENE